MPPPAQLVYLDAASSARLSSSTFGRRGGLRAAAFAQRGPARPSLGAHGGQDRLPCRQGRNGATSGPRAQRKRIAAAKLGAGGRGGLARPVGDEPDADQRIDAQV